MAFSKERPSSPDLDPVDWDLGGYTPPVSSYGSPNSRLPEDQPKRRIIELSDDGLDWPEVEPRASKSPHIRFKLPHIELPHLSIKVGLHIPHPFRRARTKYERPEPTREESFWDDPPPWDSSPRRPILSLPGDDLLEYRLRRERAERAREEEKRSHRKARVKVGAGIAGAAVLLGGVGAGTRAVLKNNGQKKTVARAPNQVQKAVRTHLFQKKAVVELL